MKSTHFCLFVPVAALVFTAACESQKSSNPLSPTVAGPIPGVEISAPKLLEPGQGWKLKATQQPITLLIENSYTTGARPLKYAFDVAVDAGFKTIVFSKREVPQGDGGRTSFRLTDKLELGRTYYWRANAYDGANTGPMASAVSFDLYPAVQISAPTLISPLNGTIQTSRRPQLKVQNSARVGPAGNINYQYQVSKDSAFSQIVASGLQPENLGGQTTWAPSNDLDQDKTHYWRVMATDGGNSSPWSGVGTFKTPASAPAPGPTPSPGPPPGGGTCVAPIKPGVSDCKWVLEKAKADLISEGQNLSGDCGAFRIVARAASMIPGAGFKKKGGTNCNGFSIKSIMFADGQDYVVLFAPGTANGPLWNFYAYSDPAIYQAYFPQTSYAPK